MAYRSHPPSKHGLDDPDHIRQGAICPEISRSLNWDLFDLSGSGDLSDMSGDKDLSDLIGIYLICSMMGIHLMGIYLIGSV